MVTAWSGLLGRCRPCLALLALSPVRLCTAALTANSEQEVLVQEDDLAPSEAFEYAMLRINEMRQQCSGFHLAPLERQNYRTVQVRMVRHRTYSEYRLHIEPVHGLAPSDIHVHIARQHSVTDLSLFQVTRVSPLPCDLYSGLDDAELLAPWQGHVAERAQSAALKVLNAERAILCPQRPQLELVRPAAAALQPAEGIVVRLALELREASEDFQTSSFVDAVSVVYALDKDVPEQCTISPEVYPARRPCSMRYEEGEQSAVGEEGEEGKEGGGAEDEGSSSSSSASSQAEPTGGAHAPTGGAHPPTGGAHPPRRLGSWGADAWPQQGGPTAHAAFGRLGEVRQAAQRRGRRLQMNPADAAAAGSSMLKRYVDMGLEIPDNFDPRLERTICFPRGFSRSQGSCGASWAFASTAVASFRECLRYLHDGRVDAGLRFFSAQELISCDGESGCSGGNAASAFYYLKWQGVAREACSPYRMRCFSDNSQIAVGAADEATSTPRSEHFESSTKACPLSPDPLRAACKCLSEVYHPTRPVGCHLLPNACPKAKVPHYYKIAGTAEGNTVPQLERHMMQELLSDGPLYVSMLVFEDFYDPVSWTESGIYIHRRGKLVGKHAATAVGWGTDSDSRDYWLLLNSFGNHWQQEGYFKVMRGENNLQMMKFGAWGVDWSQPNKDRSAPTIADVEVAFSPVVSKAAVTSSGESLQSVWLQVSAFTDEPARMLVRVQGLSSSVTGQVKDTEFLVEHVLRLDLLKIGLLGDRAKLQIWAADHTENTATWGPFSLEVFSKDAFAGGQQVEFRRLEPVEEAGEAAGRPPAPPLWT